VKTIDLKQISVVAIKKGLLSNAVPELYELKNTIENNGWHNKENVFDHTLSVLDNLDTILSKTSEKIKKILSNKVERNTKAELLRAAALFHDIAKPETLKESRGFTSCKNHELLGSKKAERILKRFNLSEKEARRVVTVIKNHDLFHKLLPTSSTDFESKLENYRKKFHEIFPELIFLSYADTLTSYRAVTNPKEFKDRIGFYKTALTKIDED
jgi:putative nucleotidyltransferase with HDIG domain